MKHDLTTATGLALAREEAGSWNELSRREGVAASTLRSRRDRLEREERHQMIEIVESLKELPDAIEALSTRLTKNIGRLATAISYPGEDPVGEGQHLWDVMGRLRDELTGDLGDVSNALVIELADALGGDGELPLVYQSKEDRTKAAA